MNKKILSGLVAGTMAVTTLIVPATASENTAATAENSGTITITYSPENYVLRHDSWLAENVAKEAARYDGEISVNVDPYSANRRTDMTDVLTQYTIDVPEAIEKVEISIPSIQFWKTDYRLRDPENNNNIVKDEDGNVVTSVRDLIMGMGIYYYTDITPESFPEDGRYYAEKGTQTNDDGSTSTIAVNPVGGTVEEVNEIVTEWKQRLWTVKDGKVIVPDVNGEAFGLELEETESRVTHNIENFDITDKVLSSIQSAENTEKNEAYFSVVYAYPQYFGVWGRQMDTYMTPKNNWGTDATITVTYDEDLFFDELNNAETAEELKAGVIKYADILEISMDNVKEEILNEKIGNYLETDFDAESFENMIEALETKDITTHQIDLSSMFNYSNWGIIGEKITSDSFVYELSLTNSAGTAYKNKVWGGTTFNADATLKDTYTFEAVDVVATTDESGTATYSTVKNGDVIDFKFDTATYSANVNNLVLAGLDKSIVIKGHEKFAKKLYFNVALFNNHNMTSNISVAYTDGTVDTIPVILRNNNQVNLSTTPNYAGTWTGISALGNNVHSVAQIGTDAEGNSIVTSGGNTQGAAFYGVDVDETKIIDSVTIPSSSNTAVVLYAFAETVMSNAELKAYIYEVEKIEEVTEENADSVLTARAYADELIERNAYSNTDFAKLDNLCIDAAWMDKENMLNITDSLNIDMMAPAGSIVEKAWPDTFDGAYFPYWKSNSDGVVVSNDMITFDLMTFDFSGETDVLAEKTGETVTFSLPEERFEDGVKDAIYLDVTDEGEKIPVKVNASGEKAKELYMLWDYNSVNENPTVTVEYSDGTKVDTTIRICDYWWQRYVTDQTGEGYPALASRAFFGWNNRHSAVANEDGTYTVTHYSDTSDTNGMGVFKIDLDPTKNPVSYTFTPGAYDSAIYAITEKTMSNSDMKAVIAEAEALEYVKTAENSELVKTAAAYAAELDRRNSVDIEDNQTVLELEKQAIAMEPAYIDLADYVNIDLIAKLGDTEMYTARDDSVYADLPEYITASAPEDEASMDSESGTVYKLSGGYNQKGNDAVKITPQDESGAKVTFDMDTKMYKHISFLIDCIDIDISADQGGDVYAEVTYADGTTETIKVNLKRGDSYYTHQYAAHYFVSFANYDAELGMYEEGSRLIGTNKEPEYAQAYPTRSGDGMSVFGFDVPTFKPVKSIALNPHATAEYAVIAITCTPYSNEELVNAYKAFEDLEILFADEVTKENAQVVLEGTIAAEELYNRYYKKVDEITLEDNAPLYEAAVIMLMPETLTFAPEISFADEAANANVTITNTTADNEPYSIIIALYNKEGQLVAVDKKDATAASATVGYTDSISIKLTTDATLCKVMVWDGLNSMLPYALCCENIK